MVKLLNLCDKLAQQRQDKFISSELFLLAIFEDKGALSESLKKCGIKQENLLQAIDKLRGGEKVNEQGAEENRQALENILLI